MRERKRERGRRVLKNEFCLRLYLGTPLSSLLPLSERERGGGGCSNEFSWRLSRLFQREREREREREKEKLDGRQKEG